MRKLSQKERNRPTKFLPGDRLRTIADLIQIHHGPRPWAYWRGRPKHTSWLMNMSVGVIHRAITIGLMREAMPNPAHKEKKNASAF